jgi:CRP-like cAMP-binding protein
MQDRSSILEFLKLGRWFGGLAPALQELIVRRAIVVPFKRGDCLIEQGAPPKGLYAVLEGTVRVTRRISDGRDLLVHVGSAGFWAGDYGALSGQTTIGSTIAETSVRALFLSAAEFERIVDEEPRHFRPFMNLLLDRYRTVFAFVAEMQGLPSEERLWRRIEGIASFWRDGAPAGSPIAIPISQAELAQMVGLSRQRLSTLLGRLEARGVIEVGFRTIRVVA